MTFLVFLLLLGYLTITGRMNWLAAVGAALLPLLRRLPLLLRALPILNLLRRTMQNTQYQAADGRQSTIRTRFLAMTLDHDTGAMDGTILTGTWQGRALSSLNREEVGHLWTESQADGDSQRVLRAWIERSHPDWAEEHTSHESPPSDHQLSKREALDILGLTKGATDEDIISAHRRLIQKLHPDRGGSSWVAAKLNEAKEILLG